MSDEMSEKDALIAQAEELARALVASEIFQKLRAIEDHVLSDEQRRAFLEGYEQLALGLQDRRNRGEEIGPDELAKINDLQQKVSADPVLTQLNTAQQEWRGLLDAVNGKIHGTLNEAFGHQTEE